MSVLERYKQRSAYKKSEDIPFTPIPESIYQPSSIEQSPSFDSSVQTGGATPVPQLSFDDPISSISNAGLTASEAPETSVALIPQNGANRQVATTIQTGTKVERAPTFIRGTGKKSSGTLLAPKVSGKRPLTHAAVVVLTIVIVLGALSAVLPLTSDGHAQGIGSLVGSLMGWSQTKNSNTASISAQVATATAVMEDGYDQGGRQNYTGAAGPLPVSSSPSGPPTSGSANLNRFYYPQCTYYANMEYGSLTGHYVPWLGDADAWPAGASASGWNVSSTPTVPSIIAFAPYVDGAGAYGHVGVVTSVNGNSVTYGSWNVAGAPAATTVYMTITAPASGVSFITYP
jgi:surface antigen